MSLPMTAELPDDRQPFLSALWRATTLFLVVVPASLFVLGYGVLPLLLTGHFYPGSLSGQFAEFAVIFLAGLWGLPVILPVVMVLRRPRERRALWGAVTGAVVLELLGCVIAPLLALSAFGAAILAAGALYGWLSARAIRAPL